MSPFAAKVHCFLAYKQLDFEPYYIHPLRVKQELPLGRQIPVLTVGTESRADSTPIGLWLDELFPEKRRLLPESGPERERLIEIDTWISSHLIPNSFRSYPGAGVDWILNGWKLGHVMGKTVRGGIALPLRAAWPFVIVRVGFVKRLVAMADDGFPVRESKFRIYDQFLERLAGGAFLGGRDEPSLPDLAAYPQFALYWAHAFRGADDIAERPELMAWLARMRPYVDREPPLIPARVAKRALP